MRAIRLFATIQHMIKRSRGITHLVYTTENQKPKQCQLRTGIARLNGYLSKINAVDSEMCSCKTGAETVHHFLFYCPLWIKFRSSIRDIGYKHNRWGDTSFFVGGWSGPSKDGEEQAWRPNKEAVWSTINYAMSTGRLKNRQEGGDEKESQRPDESRAGAESEDNEET